MNLRLLFFFLFLALLLTLAEAKPKKPCKKRCHRHRDHDHERHGPSHRKQPRTDKYADIINDIFFGILERIGDESDDDDEENSDWVLDLQALDGRCNPNPCLNNGECELKGEDKFKCDCPKPFKGRRCEKVRKSCKRRTCGRGECVLTSTPPFYECKCKEPFQPPNCRTVAVCNPNPCRNGGTCLSEENDFECQCPPGYRGRFCHVGPDDCFVDDGESYRGNVSETENGFQCLYWNSHFILENGADPFNSFEDNDGLGPHNFCRNPDGDKEPWCFFRKGRKLLWDYCDTTECPEPTDESPTDMTTPEPTTNPVIPQPAPVQPTAVLTPSTTKAAIPEKPTEASQPTFAPTETSSNTTAAPQPFSTCGKAQPKKSLTRIYGGLKVNPGSIPWQVSLQVRPKNSNQAFRHICGGVLIESCWVLTAAHCIEQNKDMQVVMGGLSLDADEPTEQTLRVEEAIRHENYRETSNAVYNDIALLRLSDNDGTCANETQFVKTACLPDGQLPDGMECTISGWGSTEDSNYGSNHLLQANVLLINQEKCSDKKIYGSVIDNTMFCAGHLQGGVDSCQGDSGGPLTCKTEDVSVVYGLVSWGDECGRKNKPGVYTRVSSYLDWIRSKTQSSP